MDGKLKYWENKVVHLIVVVVYLNCSKYILTKSVLTQMAQHYVTIGIYTKYLNLLNTSVANSSRPSNPERRHISGWQINVSPAEHYHIEALGAQLGKFTRARVSKAEIFYVMSLKETTSFKWKLLQLFCDKSNTRETITTYILYAGSSYVVLMNFLIWLIQITICCASTNFVLIGVFYSKGMFMLKGIIGKVNGKHKSYRNYWCVVYSFKANC